jgi:hypothetical protein
VRADRVRLAAVDVGPGGGVDHEVRAVLVEGGCDGCLDADVELGVGQRDDLVVGERPHQVVAELAPGAGDEDPHRAPWPRRRVTPPALSGRHQASFARYQAIVASSAASKPWAGSQPSARIRDVSIE